MPIVSGVNAYYTLIPITSPLLGLNRFFHTTQKPAFDEYGYNTQDQYYPKSYDKFSGMYFFFFTLMCAGLSV